MPLHMRLPKLRGFKNPFRVEYQVVNLDKLGRAVPRRAATSTSTTSWPRARFARTSRSRCSATARSSVKLTCRRQVLGLRRGEDRRRRRLRHSSSRSRQPAAPVDPRSSAAARRSSPHRPVHRRTSCSARSRGRSVRRTCAGSCCSRSRIIALFRLGSFIPAPGVDYARVQTCLPGRPAHSGVYGLVNLFSGGALLQLSIFALGIMPYITASIIVQLLAWSSRGSRR